MRLEDFAREIAVEKVDNLKSNHHNEVPIVNALVGLHIKKEKKAIPTKTTAPLVKTELIGNAKDDAFNFFFG